MRPVAMSVLGVFPWFNAARTWVLILPETGMADANTGGSRHGAFEVEDCDLIGGVEGKLGGKFSSTVSLSLNL